MAAALGAHGGPGCTKLRSPASDAVAMRKCMGWPSGSKAGTVKAQLPSCGQSTMAGRLLTGLAVVSAVFTTVSARKAMSGLLMCCGALRRQHVPNEASQGPEVL